MSFLTRTPRFIAAAQPVRVIVPRAFTTTSLRGLKESDRHSPNQGDAYEKHKQDGLQKQKDGKGHWKPELASDSEEAVNADRHHKGDSVEEMQKKTKDHAEEKSKHGTSQHDGL